jgi:ATP-dependent Clp protease ATP-binding subunit ClpX
MILSLFLRKKFLLLALSSMFVVTAFAQEDPSDEKDELSNAISLSTLFEQTEDELVLVPEKGFIKESEYKELSEKKELVLDIPPTIESSKPLVDLSSVPFPEEIYQELIQYTLGQDEAMKSLATFLHEHLITVELRKAALKEPKNSLLSGLSLEKPNILMMGPTGCGKTSSINVLARFLNVPFATGNATEWTAQGYIGGKWQDVFEKLASNAETLQIKEKKSKNSKDILKRAEHGIVFIDEIDKLCTKSFGDLDVIDRVQQELLPAIQGTELELNYGYLDTSNILFIAGGAFPGLISSEEGKEQKKGDLKKTITPQDLERYGMLPELAGRLCNIVQFSSLNKEAMKQIITSSKNSFLTQYMKKYQIAYGITLTFAEETIDYIAELAAQQKTGARAINAMIFKLMQDKTFKIREYVGKKLHIDKKTAKEALKGFVPSKEEISPSVAHLYL